MSYQERAFVPSTTPEANSLSKEESLQELESTLGKQLQTITASWEYAGKSYTSDNLKDWIQAYIEGHRNISNDLIKILPITEQTKFLIGEIRSAYTGEVNIFEEPSDERNTPEDATRFTTASERTLNQQEEQSRAPEQDINVTPYNEVIAILKKNGLELPGTELDAAKVINNIQSIPLENGIREQVVITLLPAVTSFGQLAKLFSNLPSKIEGKDSYMIGQEFLKLGQDLCETQPFSSEEFKGILKNSSVERATRQTLQNLPEHIAKNNDALRQAVARSLVKAIRDSSS